jgi:hypothetical protein
MTYTKVLTTIFGIYTFFYRTGGELRFKAKHISVYALSPVIFFNALTLIFQDAVQFLAETFI